MKKTIFLAAMFAALSTTATYAQDAPPQKENKEARAGGDRRGPGRDMMEMYKDLNLTKDQEAKIKAINDEQREKFQGLRNDNSMNDDSKKEKMREMQKDRQEKINAVLTKEQQEKLAAKMKDRGNRNPDGKKKKK